MSLCGSFSSKNLYRTTRPAAILSLTAATNAGHGEGFNISVWTEGKSIPKTGSAHYDAVNYIGMALSGCVVIALVVSSVFLVHIHFKKYREDRYNV
ncbi:hypothetical protein ElyMa_006901500 [Elysia marginata]|uniref:Uncharacterized protein n=1 Tax=Elysia marginata TaxID=1093978 RepID=A0AAV4JEP4_9GAST|nr:hypothetical protein ElyMa_006901500 [Elysia marginata]